MRIDFPTTLGIGTVSILCIFAVIMGFFGNDIFSDEVTESSSVNKLESDAEILVQLNQQAIKYHENDEPEKFKEQIKIMNEKLKEITYDSLGFNISIYNQTSEFSGFPFIDSESATKKANNYAGFKEDPYTICNIEEKIPIHLKKISETEMLQMFIKKYSQYPIELLIMDERYGIDSNVHYGFYATSEDGNKSAGIMFHVNSCTDIKPDQEYNLRCSEDDTGYLMWVHNRDDAIIGLEQDGFCLGVLDPWRQSIYDYGKIVNTEGTQHRNQELERPYARESINERQSESNRITFLKHLINSIVDGRNDEQATQESIQKYNDRFGNFPEELLELIEERGSDQSFIEKCNSISGTWNYEFHNCVGTDETITSCENMGGNISCMSKEQYPTLTDICKWVCEFD